MRDFNENARNGNVARVTYDLELELIERDLGFDLDEVIHLLETKARPQATAPPPYSAMPGASSTGAGHAHHILQWSAGR